MAVDQPGCNVPRIKKLPADEFKIVKFHKYKKKTVVQTTLIKISNKFESLIEEECTFEGLTDNISFNCEAEKTRRRSNKKKARKVDQRKSLL